MALTQRDSVLQMLAQLRVLDPSVSAELGTPERKILDTVAQQIADSSVDLAALSSAFDLDSKFGANLDRFLSIFGFERQRATAATGFVTFSRTSASTQDIRIPYGTQVVAPAVTNSNGVTQDVIFRTTFDVVLRAGDTFVIAPVVAATTGSLGNVAAQSISGFIDQVYGVTDVINDGPTSNGSDIETDDAFKIRFKNTVFRNVAGTQDQYLGLAVSTLATKANVVGPISRYLEYIQVPDTDDTVGGNGSVAGEYSSAISTIPYSKHIYTQVPFFVTNGLLGTEVLFYRVDSDYRMNTDSITKNKGDAYRLFIASEGPDPTAVPFQPNVTFLNVYTGVDDSVQSVRPGDIVLFEHSYMSSSSRNDYERNVLNAVDVFIESNTNTTASCILPPPSVLNVFVDDATNPYYYENYRRIGEPEHRPLLGNPVQPLFEQPVTELPDNITIDGTVYTKGTDYWLVEDISELHGTVRARNGIEWLAYGGGSDDTPAVDKTVAYNVDGYQFDQNVADLQTAIEGGRQVTADALAHRARHRYFKLDATVMYAPGATPSTVNSAIATAVASFFSSAYFGTAIQLSDLLQTIHNVTQVDNVRWTRDLPPVGGSTEIDSTHNRVVECDINGNPLQNVRVEQFQVGGGGLHEQQLIFITGSPTGGTFKLSYNGTPTASLAYNISPSTLQTQLRTATGDASLTVTGLGTPAQPFFVTFSNTSAHFLIQTSSLSLTGSPSVLNADFFLRDDELPALPTSTVTGDSVPGLIIRPKAQNTWTKA
jgi:uncharacterized phage protein gp47/JayE